MKPIFLVLATTLGLASSNHVTPAVSPNGITIAAASATATANPLCKILCRLLGGRCDQQPPNKGCCSICPPACHNGT